MALLLDGPSVDADQRRFDTPAQWQTWTWPAGTIEIASEGGIRPQAIRRSSNAVQDAAVFGGGIRQATSNPATAPWS